MKQMTDAVIDTAKRLCSAQNKVTNLEIKVELIKTHPQFFWTQGFISATMDTAYNDGMFTYQDTSTAGNYHRVYSLVTTTGALAKTGIRKVVKTKGVVKTVKVSTKKPKALKSTVKTISRTKALELMENNRGHFFTATFVSKKKGERTINCQYLKDQTYSRLGYVKVKEAIKAKVDPKDAIRQINMQTLTALKIAGNSYKVK